MFNVLLVRLLVHTFRDCGFSDLRRLDGMTGKRRSACAWLLPIDARVELTLWEKPTNKLIRPCLQFWIQTEWLR